MSEKLKRVLVKHMVAVTESPEAGHATYHPTQGLVFIKDGATWIDGRLSNHFYWAKIKKDGSLGKTRSGYWDRGKS